MKLNKINLIKNILTTTTKDRITIELILLKLLLVTNTIKALVLPVTPMAITRKGK